MVRPGAFPPPLAKNKMKTEQGQQLHVPAPAAGAGGGPVRGLLPGPAAGRRGVRAAAPPARQPGGRGRRRARPARRLRHPARHPARPRRARLEGPRARGPHAPRARGRGCWRGGWFWKWACYYRVQGVRTFSISFRPMPLLWASSSSVSGADRRPMAVEQRRGEPRTSLSRMSLVEGVRSPAALIFLIALSVSTFLCRSILSCRKLETSGLDTRGSQLLAFDGRGDCLEE